MACGCSGVSGLGGLGDAEGFLQARIGQAKEDPAFACAEAERLLATGRQAEPAYATAIAAMQALCSGGSGKAEIKAYKKATGAGRGSGSVVVIGVVALAAIGGAIYWRSRG